MALGTLLADPMIYFRRRRSLLFLCSKAVQRRQKG
jgi:hypothetical protein